MEKILYQPKYFPILNNWLLAYSSGDTHYRFNCFISIPEYHRSFQDNQNSSLEYCKAQLVDFFSVIFNTEFGERDHFR